VKTKLGSILKGDALGVLGFDLRRVCKRQGEGYYLLLTRWTIYPLPSAEPFSGKGPSSTRRPLTLSTNPTG
jgi:hypothetical protein